MVIPDRLFHHHLKSIGQVNPLISSFIWKNRCLNNNDDYDDKRVWSDSYDLVCNHTKSPEEGTAKLTFSGAVSGGGGALALSELQVLSMVVKIRNKGGGDCRADFIYEDRKNCK